VLFCARCSREAEEAEASAGDVTDELDQLRRSLSARLRSESLQRESDSLEKDGRIQQLETILKLQLQREKRKDRKISELEERVEAIASMSESRSGSLLEERGSLVAENDDDTAVGSDAETGGTNGRENKDKMFSDAPQSATSEVFNWASGDQATCSRMKDDERLEKDKETPHVHGQRVQNRPTSSRMKIPFLSKLRSSQTKATESRPT